MALPLIAITWGIAAVATAFGLYQVRWTVESVEQISDSYGGTVLLIGLGVMALAFGGTKLLRALK